MPEPASPSLSVVVPVLDEEETVAALARRVGDVLGQGPDWELVFVDDGSGDRTAEIVSSLASVDPRLRLIRLARRYGQSTAMQAGFDHARGQVVVTMDGDLQNDPADIPRLVEKLTEGYDLVAGYRVRRKDRFLLRLVPSWVANRLIRWLTGVPVRDNGCSLKAYRRDLLDRMRLYSDMHRFIPALAVGVAGARVTELPVAHHPRVAGVSKYGLARIFRVVADLASIKMIASFRDRPLMLFSLLASWAGAIGIGTAALALVVHWTFSEPKAVAVVFPGIALLFLALASFLMLLGLISEVILRPHEAGSAEGGAILLELDP